MIILVLAWIFAAFFAAIKADKKGLAGTTQWWRFWCGGWWLFFGLVAAPLAVLTVLLMVPNQAALNYRLMRAGQGPKCPACQMAVPFGATVCGHCRSPLVADAVA
jgi:hypothetical protein